MTHRPRFSIFVRLTHVPDARAATAQKWLMEFLKTYAIINHRVAASTCRITNWSRSLSS